MNADIYPSKEHYRFRFFAEDGLSVTIIEDDQGEFLVREKVLLGVGGASWMVVSTANSLEDAVSFCKSKYVERAWK